MRLPYLALINIRTKGEVGTVKRVWALQNFVTGRSKAVLLLWIIFCYLCFLFVFVMLSCLFLAALWLPAAKWLSSGCLSDPFFVFFKYNISLNGKIPVPRPSVVLQT